MSLFQRQIEVMKQDVELVGCSWFEPKQRGSQFFLRNHHKDETDLISSSDMKKIQSKTSHITKGSSNNSNKVSLKREKDKTSMRVEDRLNTQFSGGSHQSMVASHSPIYNYPKMVHPMAYYVIQPIQLKDHHPASTYSNNPLQSPQKVKIQVSSGDVSSPQRLAQAPSSLSHIPCPMQSTLKQDFGRPSIQTTMVPNKSQSNLGISGDKKSLSGNFPRNDQECPDFSVFENSDEYYFQSLNKKGDTIKSKPTKRRQKSNIFMNDDQFSRSWIKERELNDSLLFQGIVRSDISEESQSENGNKIHLRRMQDVEEIKSVADENEIQDDDDKESVVLGRLNEYASVVDLHKEQYQKNSSPRANRRFANISTIVKPIEYTP